MSKKTAITPTREQDYPEWYQQVVKAAELAENSPVRGCMVIKPWGYGIWENLQREFDRRIKATGHENAYFPLFIPLSFLEAEATHVEGFAKECAVVTHHRLEAKDGKLVPASPLEEPLVVRPTSETIIGAMFSKWVQSYRDLPLLINQWANVVRWEMRTRLFLRTTEFLWQEGHTVHVDEADARRETMEILELYRTFAEEVLAMPCVTGEKSENERFPGAVSTYCIEAMMQDRKALQAGTSHYLGTNFAKASNIQYLNEQGVQTLAHTTSWGISTRLIGGAIMTHGDDDGMKVPPRLAPKHVVILPVIPKPELEESVLAYAESIANELRGLFYHNEPLVVTVDKRDIRGGEKNWQWVKKGIPVRIEVGPRDVDANAMILMRRDKDASEKLKIGRNEIREKINSILDDIQYSMLKQARANLAEFTVSDIKSFDDFKKFFTPKNPDKPEIHGGFVRAKWCGDIDSIKALEAHKVTIRCLPLDQSGSSGKCILTGRDATLDAIFAKSY
jgi:prolyl-tRNA synthetase